MDDLKNKDDIEDIDNLKNDDGIKNKDNLNSEDNLKDKDDLKNREKLKNKKGPQKWKPPQQWRQPPKWKNVEGCIVYYIRKNVYNTGKRSGRENTIISLYYCEFGYLVIDFTILDCSTPPLPVWNEKGK